MTRREILMQTGKLAAVGARTGQGKALLTTLNLEEPAKRKLKLAVTGGHPGDPECGCAGTIARYAELGHEVVILYLNRGEGYCGQRELKECGGIRTSEAEKACAILKARGAFAAQYDGRAIVDTAHYEEFRKQLGQEKPDVVLTQWLQSEKKFALYYYEVAEDTMMFTPTEYVDISGSGSTTARCLFRACVAITGEMVSVADRDYAISRNAGWLQAGGSVCAANAGCRQSTSLTE